MAGRVRHRVRLFFAAGRVQGRGEVWIYGMLAIRRRRRSDIGPNVGSVLHVPGAAARADRRGSDHIRSQSRVRISVYAERDRRFRSVRQGIAAAYESDFTVAWRRIPVFANADERKAGRRAGTVSLERDESSWVMGLRQAADAGNAADGRGDRLRVPGRDRPDGTDSGHAGTIQTRGTYSADQYVTFTAGDQRSIQ